MMIQEEELEQIESINTKDDDIGARKKTLYIWPLALCIFVILLDQIVKRIVTNTIAPFDIVQVTKEFFWIVNVNNTGAMFSLGDDLMGWSRYILLLIFPILLLLGLTIIIVYSNWEKHLRWIMAGIVGGGMGNLIDRVFRDDGVIDFISIKFYGIFGFSRWPTFNIADSVIVISMGFWIAATLFPNLFIRHKKT